MKRLPGCCLALACVALVLLVAGCARTLAPIPPGATPSPIVLTTAPPDTWSALQQVPLHIPTLAPGEPCPVAPVGQVNPNLGDALGMGPVFLVGLGKQGVVDLSGSAGMQNGLYNILALIAAPPAYAADMLARGRQMDGPSSLLFSADNGSSIFDQWKLSPANAGQSSDGWLIWNTSLEVGVPGCYGLQIDSAGFSEVIVFQVIQG